MAAAFMALKKAREKLSRRQHEDGAEDEGPSERSRSTRSSQVEKAPAPDLLPHQSAVLAFYTHAYVQIPVALAIVANFIVIIVEKEIDPYPPEYQLYATFWENMDWMFNFIFLAELLLNMYGKFMRNFWRDPWNIFDFIVVLSGILMMAGALQGAWKNLKVLRPLRVFRLFKRIESLNKIITALFRAIPGVINAFVIMLIFMSIYAVLAVEYFSSFGVKGSFNTSQQRGSPPYSEFSAVAVSSYSMRELVYGQEYYGSFFKALYTLFQVLTGESWSEAVVRPLLMGSDDNSVSPGVVALFFVSFIVLTQIVLVNVVVAVLLDKFVLSDEEEAEESPQDSTEGEAQTPPRATASVASVQSQLAAMQEQLNSVDQRLQAMGDLKWTLQELLKALGSASTQPPHAHAAAGPTADATSASAFLDEVKGNEKMLA